MSEGRDLQESQSVACAQAAHDLYTESDRLDAYNDLCKAICLAFVLDVFNVEIWDHFWLIFRQFMQASCWKSKMCALAWDCAGFARAAVQNETTHQCVVTVIWSIEFAFCFLLGLSALSSQRQLMRPRAAWEKMLCSSFFPVGRRRRAVREPQIRPEIICMLL